MGGIVIDAPKVSSYPYAAVNVFRKTENGVVRERIGDIGRMDKPGDAGSVADVDSVLCAHPYTAVRRHKDVVHKVDIPCAHTFHG